MKKYQVNWYFEVEAESTLDAAEAAHQELIRLLRGDGLDEVTVQDIDGGTGSHVVFLNGVATE